MGENGDHDDEKESGLTTQEGLSKLHSEIETVISQFKNTQNKKWTIFTKQLLHHTNKYSTISWLSILYVLAISSTFVATHFITRRDSILTLEAILLLLLLVLGVSLELYEDYQKHNEVIKRVYSLTAKIKQTADLTWPPSSYPNIRAPFSPCIALQWTFRDGQLVNLPWSLLVRDDIIYVKPGQASPGYCEALDRKVDQQVLHPKEIFTPTIRHADEIFSTPKIRKPLQPKKYRMLETPYLNNLKISLEQALDRPLTQHNQQRYFLMKKIIEFWVVPSLVVGMVVFNFFQYFYRSFEFELYHICWKFLVIPASLIVPLVPTSFPFVWNFMNYYGMARFYSTLNASRGIHKPAQILEEEGDNANFEAVLKYSNRELFKNLIDIFLGKPKILVRSTNILHVLGSVTALCCIDKKGILSWPNPTPEKVCFLRNKEHTSGSSSIDNIGEMVNDAEDSLSGESRVHSDGSNVTVAEVLDLTHNNNDPFKLHFDDQDWYRHITSLKPLGLAILLNTCNTDTQERYVSFCSHITCEAIYNENLVPVINRRCMCELAKEIGFVDQAQKIFSLEQQLSTFRHLQPEMVRRDNKYARCLQLSTKLKFPFPHMFAVVVKELSSGSMQLLSEGTADIILDSCVDFWNGHDLCPLTNADRKKLQDFYQRCSLTAYCTAFAYRPLNKCLSKKLSDVYLELPSDSHHLYLNHRSPTPIHWECKSVLEPKIKASFSQFYSTDSLLYNDCPTYEVSDAESCFQIQCNQVFIGMVTMQYQALPDIVQLIEQLERACVRFVHFSKENELRSRVFSEKMGLESGWNCHISLSSDKNRDATTALESKPNGTERRRDPCRRLSKSNQRLPTLQIESSPVHDDDFTNILISGNLETSRNMSFSAPSAINMEHSVVKFGLVNHKSENEEESGGSDHCNLLEKAESGRGSRENCGQNAADTAGDGGEATHHQHQQHDWQSLSCLTDSTEHSAPVNFDMSNRAKLPRGIEKIRPHIECIDNVPLLVSLFTDCTPEATREMIHIMQDYGEVVCVMGSSANCDNVGIFMQADSSIAVEPLYPQMCQKSETFQKRVRPSPTDVAAELNSVSCCLNYRRDEPISIYHLIMEARHYMKLLWNAVQFWLCCSAALTIMQLVVILFLLPNLLTPGQVLWFSVVVVPLLSVSLLCSPLDADVMKKPQGKKQQVLDWNVCMFALWCYGSKFLLTLITAVTSHLGVLMDHCGALCVARNCTCLLRHSPVDEDGAEKLLGWDEDGWTLTAARCVNAFVVLVHFVVISGCFVHREHLLLKRLPHINRLWLVVSLILVVIQCGYTVWTLTTSDFDDPFNLELPVPVWVVCFVAVSPICVVVFNELIKREEIQVNQRSQKRARLDFGTKLGMNSPF